MSSGFTAGALDHRLQFLRAGSSVGVVDDGLQAVETWAAHGLPVWGSRRDISDGERWAAGQVQADVTTRFVIRQSAFSRGLTPKDRLTCGGVTFEVSGIKEIGRVWLEITAARRADG